MENYEYKTEEEYEAAMVVIERLMDKGEAQLSSEELETIRTMALSAQAYEKKHYYVEPPRTFQGMIELRMYELKLKQKDLAEKLGVSNAKLSLIMNGKQRPDVPFIKAVHTELDIPADFILQHI
ncbi:helix-turn-helix domain-containing protein [Dyadobacter sp. CY107]|uniref:helix-turn-helix domain-containing protein n=1 Tax=Dyadobacter fanqingshengii TaxID=2906443 RepID=UPI001F44178C|nr:helix-turn-helix domain-containing protein [Dyadobacter fanqingshengii]MCF2506274.1 helix-turn-helix domain-containing protein [Dyadobacter fanqingshengii]